MSQRTRDHLSFHRDSLLQLASLLAQAARCESDFRKSTELAKSSAVKASLAVKLPMEGHARTDAGLGVITRLTARYGPPRSDDDAIALLACATTLMSRAVLRDFSLATDQEFRRTLSNVLTSLRRDAILLRPLSKPQSRSKRPVRNLYPRPRNTTRIQSDPYVTSP